MSLSRLLLASALALAASGARADTIYHSLADGSFNQNWNNTGLITADDNWNGVPSLEGHLGDNLTASAGVDPRTVLGFGTGTLDVVANNADPSAAASGGVYEVEGGAVIAGNPTIAFQGSGTADAPFVLLRLNTTGCSNINVAYNLRDIDTAELTPAQPFVLQARVGQAGNFANVDGTYVAVANTGGTIPGAAILPAGFENQAQVQIRWLTTNAVDTDAMIGIDDIQVTGSCADIPPTVASTVPSNNATGVSPSNNLSVQFSEAVTTNVGWFGLSCTSSGPVTVAETGSGAARTLDPVSNLAFGEQCTATILAASVIDQDGMTLNPMAANFVYTFTVQPDNLPTVLSTTPANLASNVAAVSNINVQFSESVTTNAGWFGLSCTSSGNVSVAESGSGASRSLDPVPVLAPGETCTGTISAAQVIDQDGVANPMAANFVFSFTVQADDPPTVLSTVPATGVSGVAIGSNITINFSEAVSVSGSWYAINCASSGAHPAVVSGSGSSYSLNPDVDFAMLELCTVTLTAALVLDQDGTPDPLTSNYSWTFTSAAAAADYYANVNASNAATLRITLHETIDDHVRVAYTAGTPNTWSVLNVADEDPLDTSKILDVYKNTSYTKISGGQGVYNREHTWPNSLGFGNNNDGAAANALNYPYTDTHMLYLSDTAYNSNRGNKYFGTCSASCTEDPTLLNHGQGGGTGTYPGNSNWFNGVLYEVWGKRKGDMARAMFYMDIRYEGGTHSAAGAAEPDLILTDTTSLIQNTGGNASVGYMGLLSVLLQWHVADPVTPAEVIRNQVIQNTQGNRNPFIDHPEWVACLWQNQCAPTPMIFTNGFE